MANELLFTRSEVRSLDQAAVDELGLSGTVLMENAARGVCDAILARMKQVHGIFIVCGAGNNGGDGLALARQLACHGIISTVTMISAGKQLTPDAEFNRRAWWSAGGALNVVETSDEIRKLCDLLAGLDHDNLIVDCLLGTGLRGPARSPFAEVIAAINSSAAEVLAVDVPSGMDCETGSAAGECIRADWTVTFAGMKTGFVTPQASEWTGPVHVAHIGIPAEWVRKWLARNRLEQGHGS